MPKNCQKVLKDVLKQIVPKKEEKKKIASLTEKALKIAKEEAKKFNAKPILAGSTTRDTWLPGKKEFDVFILFPSIPEKKLEEIGLKLGKKIITKLKGSYKIEYAQHPYVSGTVSGIDIDVVPCYELDSTDKLKSAVDRTPFHVKYIEKHLPMESSNEVRLLKQFCTANGVYGADAKTEGFSGYVCELLIIKYGKFLDVLRNVVNWRPGEVIDIEKFYPEADYPKLRKIFKDQVLILVDPTDKNRNTAAALSAQSFYKLKKVANEFLTKPSKEIFFGKEEKPITENELVTRQIKRRTELILVKFTPPKIVPDILWPQLRRFADRLQNILEETRYEFRVLRKDAYTNEKDLAVVLLEMETSKLPAIQKRIGPRVSDMDDSKRFIDKYKKQALAGPFVENNFWAVEVKRKFLTAREKLKDSLKENVKILEAKGIPNHIASQIAKKFEIILESGKTMELAKKDPNFGIFLKKYFEKETLV